MYLVPRGANLIDVHIITREALRIHQIVVHSDALLLIGLRLRIDEGRSEKVVEQLAPQGHN